MDHRDIASRLKSRRMELDISVSDLASRLSMSKATIHRYESGEIKQIKIPVMVSLARELKVSPAWLMGKTDDKGLIDYADARDKYSDMVLLFDDVASFIRYGVGLKVHGRSIEPHDREALADGVELLRRVILDRYR